jgi:ElaB/YqjD/DUF883 family membrane-anchored ribosome-binding protein
MRSKPKNSVISAKSVSRSVSKSVDRSAKSVGKLAANASKKTGSALAVVAKRVHVSPRVVKHARATLKGLPGRTTKFVKSHPVRVLVGAAAAGFVLAKLKHLV